ncbi:MAG: hypothetical protein JO048_03960 [Methylobacteriaceae bacterium]|nr:hypothetical protein [Methylobacteriaceae bacterium]
MNRRALLGSLVAFVAAATSTSLAARPADAPERPAPATGSPDALTEEILDGRELAYARWRRRRRRSWRRRRFRFFRRRHHSRRHRSHRRHVARRGLRGGAEGRIARPSRHRTLHFD